MSIYKYIRPARFDFPIIEDWITQAATGFLGWQVSNVNGASSVANGTEANRQGILQMRTGTLNNNTARTLVSLGSLAMSFESKAITQQSSLRIRQLSSVGQEIFYSFGLGDDNTSSPDNQQGAYFVYNPVVYGSDNWHIVSAKNSLRTIIDTGVAPDTDFHNYKIEYLPSLPELKFYIDDILVGSITTNIPQGASESFCPYYKLGKSLTTNAVQKITVVDWMILEIER